MLIPVKDYGQIFRLDENYIFFHIDFFTKNKFINASKSDFHF